LVNDRDYGVEMDEVRLRRERRAKEARMMAKIAAVLLAAAACAVAPLMARGAAETYVQVGKEEYAALLQRGYEADALEGRAESLSARNAELEAEAAALRQRVSELEGAALEAAASANIEPTRERRWRVGLSYLHGFALGSNSLGAEAGYSIGPVEPYAMLSFSFPDFDFGLGLGVGVRF